MSLKSSFNAMQFLLFSVLVFCTILIDQPTTTTTVLAEEDNSNNLIDRNFTSSIVLTLSPNILDATSTELTELSQLLVSSYNEWRTNTNVNDPYQRIATNVTRIVGADDSSSGSGFTYSRHRTRRDRDRRQLRHDLKRQQQKQQQQQQHHQQSHDRRLDEDSTTTSSSSPSSSPTTVVARNNRDAAFNDGIDLLFEVSGSCSNCPDDLFLTHDTVGRRRRRQLNKPADDSVVENAQETIGYPHLRYLEDTNDDETAEEQIVSILSEKLTNIQSNYVVYDLSEVKQEESCPVEMDFLEAVTTFVIDSPIVIPTADLEREFVESYNRLSTDYCDIEFRRVVNAVCSKEEQIQVNTSIDGTSTTTTTATRYTFLVSVTCRDCLGIFSWSTDGNRRLETPNHYYLNADNRWNDRRSRPSRENNSWLSSSSLSSTSSNRVLGSAELDVFLNDRPCYCSIVPLAARAPTKEEFETYFMGRLEWLGLFDTGTTRSPTISPAPTNSPTSPPTNLPPPPLPLPNDCVEVIANQDNILNNGGGTSSTSGSNIFTATIVVTFSSDILSATQEELDSLGQVVLAIYNRENVFNSELCDPNWRFVYSVDVQTDFEFSRRHRRTLESDESGGLDVQQHPVHSLRGRVLVDDTDPSTSTAPSSAPTSTVVLEDQFADLLFTITGSCSDCDDDLNLLSDDVVGRRRLSSKTRNLQELVPEDATCACSVDADPRSPTADELLAELDVAVNNLSYVSDAINVVEVDVERCSEELEIFETLQTVSFDVAAVFGSEAVPTTEIEEAFVCTYNRLITQQFCDPAYRTAMSATCIDEQIGSGTDSTFTFAVDMKCHNCTGIFDRESVDVDPTVFSTSRDAGKKRRFLSESQGRFENNGQCYCASNGPRRAPTRAEFEAVFNLCVLEPPTSSPLPDFPTIGVDVNDAPITPPTSPPTEIGTTPSPVSPTPEPTVATPPPTPQPTPEPTPDPTLQPTPINQFPQSFTLMPTPEPTKEPTNEPTPQATFVNNDPWLVSPSSQIVPGNKPTPNSPTNQFTSP